MLLRFEVKKFAKEHGYDKVKYICKYKEHKAYQIYNSDKQVSYVGIPMFALVNKNRKMRVATSDEVYEIMDRI